MAKLPKNCSDLTAASLLLFLRRYGGSAPLHSINFSRTVIQSLLDRELVRVQNTKHGFLLTITQDFDKLPTN
ncbi:hypothetical protein [Nostoc sp. 'Peltigera membranacea cyanobiont' 232]|uniref:hypothetical protein n=1 Tax=Nostoc sp. 'Peltigera membranacea cyanobiont' 232 TaxID=2014531 RepID=UPI001CB9B807|nr:hypothetical protein [Nostoc sp. 'Peltigera membranacea cyanobiont' 232]